MDQRQLGHTGLGVSPIGFGAFKIGRNTATKYPHGYDLPDQRAVDRLLNGVLDVGINYIDTAPAYGQSEERIGQALSHRRGEYVLGTKVGETFHNNRSHYDYSRDAVYRSVTRSLRRLRTDVLDVVLIHSDGRDLWVMNETDVVQTLVDLRTQGCVRAIGLSGKTVEGARAALSWADVIMVTYHLQDRSHEPVIEEAAEAGVGVVVKKGLASGTLGAAEAIGFVLGSGGITSGGGGVDSLVIGGLNLEHLRSNIRLAERWRSGSTQG